MLFTRAISAQLKPPVPTRTGENVLLPSNSTEIKKHKEAPKRKTLRKIGNGIINVSKTLLTLGIFTYLAMFKVPGTQKAINEYNRLLDDQPKPCALKPAEEHLGDLTIDHFVANYPIEKILKAVEQEKINLENLNTNKNEFLFDESIEIKALIDELKSKDRNKFEEEIKLLEEINVTSQLIWGVSRPSAYNTDQGGKDNCQVMSAIQGQWLTERNTQDTRGRVTVTFFNLSKEDLRIDTIVEINGNKISIPFEELIKWMSPQGTLPSYSTDNSLSTPILTYAIEKELEKYGGVPNKYSSAPATLITGNDYCSMFLTSLSDDELINILSKAPQTPTHISTYKYLPKDYTAKNLMDRKWIDFQNISGLSTDEEVKQQSTSISRNPPDIQKFKGQFFVRTTSDYLEQINSGKFTYEPLRRSKTDLSDISSYHSYTVKEFKKVNGEYITTIIDSNRMEFDLTLPELRIYGRKITSESQNFPAIGEEGFQSTLISLALIIAILAAAHKLNITINPNYKSTLVKVAKTLTSKLRHKT